MVSDLDAELDSSIESATKASGSPDSPAALEALALAEQSPVVKISSASSSELSFAAKKRRSKSEVQAELDAKEAALSAANAELETLRARTNTDAIANLGGVIAFAITLSGDWVAARRGIHWRFEQDEAKRNGDAWAFALAPYAERIAAYAPWLIAAQVSYMSLRPRMEQDKLLLPRPESEKIDDNGAS